MNRRLELPHGYVTTIDESDWPTVQPLTLYRGANGYVYYSVWRDGRSRPSTLHGFLMQTPKGLHTDHINGDKLDNRRANLRIVTPSVNQANRHRQTRGATGVRGVTHRAGTKNPWIAQIMVDRRQVYLGSFSTLEAATDARRAAELEHYGELCP